MSVVLGERIMDNIFTMMGLVVLVVGGVGIHVQYYLLRGIVCILILPLIGEIFCVSIGMMLLAKEEIE